MKALEETTEEVVVTAQQKRKETTKNENSQNQNLDMFFNGNSNVANMFFEVLERH